MKHYYSNSPLKRLKNSGVLLLSACAILVSCQQELKGPQAEGEENRLTFNARVDGSFVSLSRGTSGDVTIENSGFTTIGYMTDGLYSISDATKLPTPNVFNAESLSSSPLKKVSRNTSDKYQVELPKIEHKDGSHLSFFAWAQAAGEGGITATTDNASQAGYPWIDVEVALPNQTQRDVVGASTMNLPNEYVVSAVDLDFKHLLSKVSFKIKAPTAATVNVISTQCAFGADKVYQKGRFTFNGTDTVGVWADRNTYFPSSELTPSGWLTPTLASGNPALLGEMLLLPQKVEDGFLTLKVNYTLTVGGVVSEVQSRTVTLRATELLQGRNHVYTLLVNADEVSLFNISIAPWIEGETGSLPLIPGPKGDVVLLLDGNESPYTHTDGNQYWLDASGWNNHCLIENSVSSTDRVSYDAENKGYFIPVASSTLKNHIRIPNLGTIAGDVSFEVVCKNDMGASAEPYPFVLTRKMASANQNAINSDLLLYPDIAYWAYQMQFQYRNQSSAENISMNLGTVDHSKRFYVYGSRKASDLRVVMGCNDTHFLSCTNKASSSSNGTQTIEGGYIGPKFKGTIHYLKITKNAVPDEQFMENYQQLASKFRITRVPHGETNDHTQKPANCYWANVPTQNKIKFNPTLKPVRGNGSLCSNVANSGVSSYSESIQSMNVAWQTRLNHGMGSESRFISNYWYDKTTNTCVVLVSGAGNAVMSGRNSSGTIKWTYHIWGIEGGLTTQYSNGIRLLRDNLGALASTGSSPSSSNAYKYWGLMYQWGSKQPFIGQGNSTTAGQYAHILDGGGTRITDYADKGGFRYLQSTAWDYAEIIANPLWYRGSNNTYLSFKFIGWTPGSKTLFDPCPYGYRVPSKGEMEMFGMDRNVNGYSQGIAAGFTRNYLWWPAAGGRGIFGEWQNAGHQVRVWTSSSYDDNNTTQRWNMLTGPGGDFYWTYTSGGNDGFAGSQSMSRSIRCIKSDS